MAATAPRGMKIGAVSLWLLLLLSEKPMYGYEVIRELEKRFSGYWRPKTGTIYPAFEKLEEGGLVTSRIEFRDEGLDRKHYALTEKGRTELAQTMSHWIKMMEVLENYREVHESIFRYKDRLSKEDLSRALVALGEGLGRRSVDLSKVLPGHQKKTLVQPTDPVTIKLLYAKEEDELEIHMELKWTPTRPARPGTKPAPRPKRPRPNR
ncbi:MAG TPA: helix-turn-helix transcriptional regulator [Thermoplasmata archaeon]|nr:helix-turn-helix transcriptional regulator [Thermoplasmata archaeon]